MNECRTPSVFDMIKSTSEPRMSSEEHGSSTYKCDNSTELGPTFAMLARATSTLDLVLRTPNADDKRTRTSESGKRAVFLTGANGNLGIHTLYQLIQLGDIRTVYCPVRAENHAHAEQRIERSLRDRGIPPLGELRGRGVDIQAFRIDTKSPRLGLDDDLLQELCMSVDAVIHLAWPVNFLAPISHFQESIDSLVLLFKYFPGAQHTFVSSISTILAWDLPNGAPEALTPDPRTAWLAYGRSKWVAEHLCSHANRLGVSASVIRTGQLVGDTKHGMWNAREATATMIRSAPLLGAAPARDSLGDKVNWLPIDQAAWAIAMLGCFRTEAPPQFRLVNLAADRLLPWSFILEILLQSQNLGPSFNVLDYHSYLETIQSKHFERAPTARLRPLFEYFGDNQHSLHLATPLLTQTLIAALKDRGLRSELAELEVSRRLQGVDAVGIGKTIQFWRKQGLILGSDREELVAKL